MIVWALFFGVSCALIITTVMLAGERKEAKKKDVQIKMLMERIWNLKKVIKDNGLV